MDEADLEGQPVQTTGISAKIDDEVAGTPSKVDKKNKRRRLDDDAASSALGARLFYFITYGLYYGALLIYKNPLRDVIFFANDFAVGDLIWLLYYVSMHAIAIKYFLTAGNNPGFVKESDPDVEIQAN